MSLTGRLRLGALVLLCVLLIFNINKAHVYQVKNIERGQVIRGTANGILDISKAVMVNGRIRMVNLLSLLWRR